MSALLTRVAPSRAWMFAMICAIAIGAYVRLDQFGAQVLIDDEWHAVHQVLVRSPAQMFFDFGFSDYSIPLGMLAWVEAHTIGLSETLMRLPMMVCALLTLVIFPAYAARRFGASTAAVFAWLLALSPLLVIFSRMARPYAITLLLGWVAHAAFQRYWRAERGARAGVAYGATAALATWLHPIVGPFVVAPFVWALADLRRSTPPDRRRRFVRLLRLALPTGAVMAALVLPPLVANPVSMTLKSGVDSPTLDTLVGALHLWFGTTSGVLVAICIVLAAIGGRAVFVTLPEARTAALGIALTLAALFVTRPAWSSNAISVARYLLPIVPLLLLAVACGIVAIARFLVRAPWPQSALAAVLAVPVVASLAALSPLPDLLRRPNSETIHLSHHFDLRPGRNDYSAHMDRIPLSPFWATLAAQPRDSLRIAAAPFYFESFDWDAPRWEERSGQRVLPGFLSGLCTLRRFGEVPRDDAAYRFTNAVHLADDRSLVERGIDYVVWQKPYVTRAAGQRELAGAATLHCEEVLRERFGPPAYEDAALVAFRLKPPGAHTDAAR